MQRMKVVAGGLALACLLVVTIAPATAARDVCVSRNGVLVYDSDGEQNCITTPGGNTAVAIGDVNVGAGGGESTGNTAIGVGSFRDGEFGVGAVSAAQGNNQTAIGINSLITLAANGDDNRNVAIDSGLTTAETGDNNTTVTVRGGVTVSGIGDNNTAVAVDSEGTTASEGNNNTAVAVDSVLTVAGTGDDNLAAAIRSSITGAIGGNCTVVQVNDVLSGDEDCAVTEP